MNGNNNKIALKTFIKLSKENIIQKQKTFDSKIKK